MTWDGSTEPRTNGDTIGVITVGFREERGDHRAYAVRLHSPGGWLLSGSIAALSGLPRGMLPLLEVSCIGSETAELDLRGQECARHWLL